MTFHLQCTLFHQNTFFYHLFTRCKFLFVSDSHTNAQINSNLQISKERLVHTVRAQDTPWTRSKNSQHVTSARRILSESAVNRQIELCGNTVTRCGRSI